MMCIVLTGGPCAGKSSALAVIPERLRQEGVDVYVVPELATILCTGGTTWTDDVDYRVEYLTAQCRLQTQLEASFAHIATATGRPSVLICDRGVFDCKAFVSAEAWKRVVEGLGMDEDAIACRYHGVVHLVTTAWERDKSGLCVPASASVQTFHPPFEFSPGELLRSRRCSQGPKTIPARTFSDGKLRPRRALWTRG